MTNSVYGVSGVPYGLGAYGQRYVDYTRAAQTMYNNNNTVAFSGKSHQQEQKNTVAVVGTIAAIGIGLAIAAKTGKLDGIKKALGMAGGKAAGKKVSKKAAQKIMKNGLKIRGQAINAAKESLSGLKKADLIKIAKKSKIKSLKGKNLEKLTVEQLKNSIAHNMALKEISAQNAARKSGGIIGKTKEWLSNLFKTAEKETTNTGSSKLPPRDKKGRFTKITRSRKKVPAQKAKTTPKAKKGNNKKKPGTVYSTTPKVTNNRPTVRLNKNQKAAQSILNGHYAGPNDKLEACRKAGLKVEIKAGYSKNNFQKNAEIDRQLRKILNGNTTVKPGVAHSTTPKVGVAPSKTETAIGDGIFDPFDTCGS